MPVRANSTGLLRRALNKIFYATAACALVILSACTLPSVISEDENSPIISGPPVVTIVSPLNQARYLTGVNVNILAAVSNAGADINRVEVSVDDTIIATIPEPNPSGAANFSVTQTWPAGAAGSHSISVVVFRNDGSASATAATSIEVVAELPVVSNAQNDTATPTNTLAAQSAPSATPTTQQATNTPAPSATPQATTPAATATSDSPIAVGRGVYIRRGPSVNFEPPLGVLGVGESAPIIGLNTDDSWLKIRYGDGEGWVFKNFTDIQGDISGLPREAGPATPIPPTPTTAQVVQPTAAPGTTSVPSSGANLIVENFVFEPKDPFCNQNAQAKVNIGNIGNQATGTGGFVVLAVENTDGSNRQTLGSAAIPVIEAGTRNFLVIIDFKDTFTSNRGDGIKRALILIDPNNQIPESNDNDNNATNEFALGVPCQ